MMSHSLTVADVMTTDVVTVLPIRPRYRPHRLTWNAT